MFTQLSKKNNETEVVTKTKIQRQIVENKSDSELKAEIKRLQDELKNNVVQGEEKAKLEAEIKRLQEDLKKTDFNKWKTSEDKVKLDSILANIDAVEEAGGPTIGNNIIQWNDSFEKLLSFVKDRTKRQLLVNSGQTSKDQKEKDFYQFIQWLNQAINLKEKNDEQAYDFLLTKVKNKFGILFQKKFNDYFTASWYAPKNTALGLMLKHILSKLKIRESNIK